MNLLRLIQGTPQPQADLTRVYDAIVIGSGAAGGMAAHVLTSQGMKVLLLEAGKQARHRQGAQVDGVAVRAPAPRRHAARASCADAQRIQRSAQPPYAAGLKHSTVYSYVQGWSGPDYSKNIVVNEKEHPVHGHATTPGCAPAAWAGRPTSGDAWRCASPTSTSRRRATTATARTGRSRTRTSRPTTTASISTSGSPASRRTCRTCPTASSSGRHGSMPRRSRSATR